VEPQHGWGLITLIASKLSSGTAHAQSLPATNDLGTVKRHTFTCDDLLQGSEAWGPHSREDVGRDLVGCKAVWITWLPTLATSDESHGVTIHTPTFDIFKPTACFLHHPAAVCPVYVLTFVPWHLSRQLHAILKITHHEWQPQASSTVLWLCYDTQKPPHRGECNCEDSPVWGSVVSCVRCWSPHLWYWHRPPGWSPAAGCGVICWLHCAQCAGGWTTPRCGTLWWPWRQAGGWCRRACCGTCTRTQTERQTAVRLYGCLCYV
jgi:hypothetical protein